MKQQIELERLGYLEGKFPREIRIVREFYFKFLAKQKVQEVIEEQTKNEASEEIR